MIQSNKLSIVFKYGTLLLCLFWLVNILYQNELPADVGDGLTHFFISQASWSNVYLMLDHWGKPLFTLLSSPLAQFGFQGYVLFNIIVFGITIGVAYKVLNHYKVPNWLQGLFPLILLTANDVVITVTGGLTEPLFNLFLVVALYCLTHKKWILFAIFISFMPFLRSEGQLPVILTCLILSYNRQWKSLPFLLTGFLVYAIIGSFLLGNFWWYFTDSPYAMDNDIYGKGSWNHYLVSYRNYIGNPGLYLLLLGLPMSLYFFLKKKWNKLNIDATILVYGTFFGVVFSHSYFWATGQNGSMGLTRIATQGATAFLLLQLILISYYPFWKKYILIGVGFLGCIGIGISLINHKKFPIKATPSDLLAIEACEFIKDQNNIQSVYYYFPLVGYQLGQNPKKQSEDFHFYIGSNFEEDVKSRFQEGDLLVWDSHFSPQEGALPLVKIENSNSFTLIHIGAEGNNEIRIYKFGSDSKSGLEQINLEDRTLNIESATEFVDVFSEEELKQVKKLISLQVISTNEKLRFVIDNEQPEGYHSINTSANKTSITAQKEEAGKWHIYVWNPDKVKGEVSVSGIKTFDLNNH